MSQNSAFSDIEIEDGQGFVSLDSYVTPTLETAGALRRMLSDLWSSLRPRREARENLYEQLWDIDEDLRNDIAPPPACGPLVRDLHHTVKDWLRDEDASESARLIVYPPGHRAEFIRRWAERVGGEVIDAPGTGDIHDIDLDSHLEALHNGRLVVVPCLQDWYTREVGGLELLQTILVAVSRSPDKVVIGCDSWAWQFFIKSVNAHHLLPEASVFQAFGEDRLRDWFQRLVRQSAIDDGTRFRSARDGTSIFDTDGKSTYFRDLAAQSLGVPWVAWAIWRESLFTTERDALADDIWVRPPTLPSLPDTDERESLLILHALLIHDGLSVDTLGRVLPFIGASTALAMLQRAGFVIEEDGICRVSRPAYPTIKAALEDAGYPGDGL